MTGEKLRNKLKTIKLNGQKISFSTLASGLGMTAQAFNSKLGAKRISDEFVTDIANALKIDRTILTSEDNEGSIEESSTHYMKHPPKNYQEMLIESQQEQIRLHQKLEKVQDELLQVYKEKKGK